MNEAWRVPACHEPVEQYLSLHTPWAGEFPERAQRQRGSVPSAHGEPVEPPVCFTSPSSIRGVTMTAILGIGPFDRLRVSGRNGRVPLMARRLIGFVHIVILVWLAFPVLGACRTAGVGVRRQLFMILFARLSHHRVVWLPWGDGLSTIGGAA